MKTKTIFLTMAGCVMAALLHAQIKVSDTGKVGIGTNSFANDYHVTTEGDSILFRSKTSNAISFEIYYSPNGDIIDFGPTDHTHGGYYTLGYFGSFDYMQSDYGFFYDLVCFNTFTQYSDRQLKKNVVPIPYRRDKFQQLQPVSFDISDSLLISDRQRKSGKHPSVVSQYGFIAQDIQSVYPQLVATDSQTGYLMVKPLELIPILVSALQDQQSQLDTQADQIKKLMSLVATDEAGGRKIIESPALGIHTTGIVTSPSLYQNNPNPFSQSTQIKYYLPETVGTAYLCIYNLQGKQLKQIAITERGQGQQIISGSEFTAGIYLYGLLADGKEIDVKRMILTE